MAHWIVKGRLFECSKCHAIFSNYFRDMDDETTCPCCGAPINQEENQNVRSKMQNV